ncbi:DNA-3-methyladenine glycosylase I, partial [Escherichia coli]
WKFVGPTTVYAFMQAMRLINDHVEHCVMREKAELARNAMTRPI